MQLLEGLEGDDARRVLAAARRRRFARREVLFHQGDPADCLHLVTKGRIAVRIASPLGESVTLDIAGTGAVLGELALLRGEHRSATAVAVEPSETLAITASAFDDLRRRHPSVGDVLIQLLAARVRRLDRRLVEALYVPADIRVLRRLLELSEAQPEAPPSVALTQEDLAGLAGTTRETVNRVLRREEERGAVALRRGRVDIVDRDALARRAR